MKWAPSGRESGRHSTWNWLFFAHSYITQDQRLEDFFPTFILHRCPWAVFILVDKKRAYSLCSGSWTYGKDTQQFVLEGEKMLGLSGRERKWSDYFRRSSVKEKKNVETIGKGKKSIELFQRSSLKVKTFGLSERERNWSDYFRGSSWRGNTLGLSGREGNWLDYFRRTSWKRKKRWDYRKWKQIDRTISEDRPWGWKTLGLSERERNWSKLSEK